MALPADMTRRAFVRLAAAGGLAALAGCTLPSSWIATSSSSSRDTAPVFRRDRQTNAKIPITVADLEKQPDAFPFHAEWESDAARPATGFPVIVLVLPLTTLVAASKARNFNTGQYAIQHPTLAEYVVLAYMGKCTHLGCTVGWNPSYGGSKDIPDYDGDGVNDGRILCPCHGGQFDVYDMAKNVPGTPPPRPLDVLRIRIGPWTDGQGVETQDVILGVELVAQPTYRSADRQGDGAPFHLQG